jgi:hypothetical protein
MQKIEFNSRSICVIGVLAGMALAGGSFWMMLTLGRDLGSLSQTLVIGTGILMGLTVAGVSAFFGLAMPSLAGVSHGHIHIKRGLWNLDLRGRLDGPTITESRELTDFDQIELQQACSTEITVSGPARISIEGEESSVAALKTEIVDRVLRISGGRRITNLRISTSALRSVSLLGSGNTDIHNLKPEVFEMLLAGSGNVRADGTATNVIIKLTGSGNIDATCLQSEKANVIIQGSGNIKVNAARELDATITGSGNIRYLGAPVLQQTIRGSGAIKRA